MTVRQLVEIECDYCGEVDEYEVATVDEAMLAADLDGWLLDPDEDDVCPECMEGIREDFDRMERESACGAL